MIGAAYQRTTKAQSTPAFELLIDSRKQINLQKYPTIMIINYPYHKNILIFVSLLDTNIEVGHKSLDPNNPIGKMKVSIFNP